MPKRSVEKAKPSHSGAILVVTASNRMRGLAPRPLRVDLLAENVNIFLGKVGSILERTPQSMADARFQFVEFSISVEISAKGELSILGSGGGMEAKGGLTFTFKRN